MGVSNYSICVRLSSDDPRILLSSSSIATNPFATQVSFGFSLRLVLQLQSSVLISVRYSYKIPLLVGPAGLEPATYGL